ncbi:MAG: glycerophosphodiester phosphodiesterase family protein [Gammaproteobacteria bacterium]|nr:glycerophosphodiester phosphodiesterase family protein [Gammaproteobacteria bacterium]MDH5731340.1 glycerophosphodiester phosphodiesterase family protein [Gammaproteobacteria bacterium]
MSRKFYFVIVLFTILIDSPALCAFELIAHRGVYQTFSRENLDNQTCTATRINPPSHGYIENTVGSIEKAFALGATMVEIDIHPTREAHGQPHLVVFHDWTLNCRTNASCEQGCQCNDNNQCVTHDQRLKYLKELDIGYGYTSDQGNSYPFRGKFIGQMPQFNDVVDLLYRWPKKQLLVNQKDNRVQTVRLFLDIMKNYPLQIKQRVHFPHNLPADHGMSELHNYTKNINTMSAVKTCLKKYILLGWGGIFPQACEKISIFIPLQETMQRFLGDWASDIKVIDFIWGWPNDFIKKANQHQSRIYVTQVDTKESWDEIHGLPIHGIMTDRIEVIAPLMQSLHSK